MAGFIRIPGLPPNSWQNYSGRYGPVPFWTTSPNPWWNTPNRINSQFDGVSNNLSHNVTATVNNAVGPTGFTDATLVTDDAVNTYHGLYINSISYTGPIIFSAFAKAGTCSYLNLVAGSVNTGPSFNLANGAVNDTPAGWTTSIQAVGATGSGWYRCCGFYTAVATDNYYWLMAPGGQTNVPTYAGVGSTIYLWGAGFQTGSTLTPYRWRKLAFI